MQIRVWTLGYLDKKNPTNSIFPTKEGMDRFEKALKEVLDAGGGDLIWGPELSCQVIECDSNYFDKVVSGAEDLSLVKNGKGIKVKI